jgi:methionine-rich copper-binding protein CopC
MRVKALLGIVLIWAVSVLPVKAHALLDHAKPDVGSTVPSSPSEIALWFTHFLKPGHCTIQVRDAHGKEVDKKDSHCDDKDKMLLRVSVPKLSPGTYSVTWHVTSDDGHVTRGKFKFTIRNPIDNVLAR